MGKAFSLTVASFVGSTGIVSPNWRKFKLKKGVSCVKIGKNEAYLGIIL